MLVFSLRRGEAFYIQDTRVQLIDFTEVCAVLAIGKRTFRCENHLTEILPSVRVSAGLRQERAIRIGIEAPFEIKILREKLYRAARAACPEPPPKRPRRYFAGAMDCRTCRGTMRVQQHDGTWVPCPAAQAGLPICNQVD